MSEFSRSGPQMPTEQRRQAQVEYEADLRRVAGEDRAIRDTAPRTRHRPWWRRWGRH